MKKAAQPFIPVSKIYAALSNSPASKSLRENLRFNPFRHHTEHPKHWVKVLGPSAITFSHMKKVYRTTSSLLHHELKMHPHRFSHADQEALLLAAVVHDFGEAMLDKNSVGDIPAPTKRTDHEIREQKVFKKVLKSLDLNKKLKDKIWKSYYEVCHNQNSHLHKFFHLIEHLEYIDTGLTIYKNLTKSKLKLKRGKHLIGQILTFSIPLLVNYEHNSHHSIHRFLRTRGGEIQGMFLYCLTEYKMAEKRKQVILGISSAWFVWKQYYNL